MRRFLISGLMLGLAATSFGSAFASPNQPYGMDRRGPTDTRTPELPHCDRALGTAAIKEPSRDWWSGLGLSNPEALLKLYALKSGCLRIVDRGAGLGMHNTEGDLNRGGDLQRGSNVGRGQVAAADFFIIPDIAESNSNSGGNNVGAAVGSFLPGGFGALAGSVRSKSAEAHTLITLEDARTLEQLHISEGAAKKTDWSIGAGGLLAGTTGIGGLAGSGYTNTDQGKVIAAAYFNAFIDLVEYMQAQQPGAAQANAPIAAQRVTDDVGLRKDPTPQGKILFTLHAGALVYPTGQRNGVWMEVDDENGNRGWISSARATAH